MSGAVVKLVSDPCAEYLSLQASWRRSRALCGGESAAKAMDRSLDTLGFTNLLLPFSPSMTPEQFSFYKAEAELPGITAEFSKMLIGGLLRKPPALSIPEALPEDALDWITNEFSEDGLPLMSFLDNVLLEEVETSRAWVYVDYPVEDSEDARPYPVIWPAESVINWRVSKVTNGRLVLSQVIVRVTEEEPATPEVFHPEIRQVVYVHELDESGLYQIRKYMEGVSSPDDYAVAGKRDNSMTRTSDMKLVDTFTNFMVNGKRLDFIPAWPLNGQIAPTMPLLMPIIDKEVALYNKVSRRNHLLLGAATYTPVVFADITDEVFEQIVGKGLGSWIKLSSDSKIDVLKTPTEALQDMEKAIAAGIEEIARLGVRMLSPESTQSGVALSLRNASQSARLSSLSTKVSSTMQSVIAFMLSWRYKIDINAGDVQFKLSEDFTANPMTVEWLRLITDWYEAKMLPRSAWLDVVKRAEVLRPEYDDKEGMTEITEDVDFGKTKPLELDKQ